MQLRIGLVIPILNEASGLLPLLTAIRNQTRRPDEIIFVDAGSTDSSLEIITEWWEQSGWSGALCRVEVNPGGYPGHNRNVGIKLTTCDWIAFIDCGIYPDADWLEQLCTYAGFSSSPAVFGICRFLADSVVSKATCALSYGIGTEHSVLPASLFHKSIFTKCGMFDEELRAAEDVKWILIVESKLGPKVVCLKAKVHYASFPTSIQGVARKYFLYQKHVIRAGLGARSNAAYICVASGWLVLLLINPEAAAWSFGTYIVLRGIVDPLRRSREKQWWGTEPLAILIAPIVALVIDMAKLMGIIHVYSCRKQ